MNGFLEAGKTVCSKIRESFNSIEWIPKLTIALANKTVRKLSIPLNGFQDMAPPGTALERLRLSIPLNGFTDATLQDS